MPLCYCFCVDEGHIRDEVSRTGRTTVPERISRLIREGLCACEVRNPAGVCCLGEVNRAAKRLTNVSPVKFWLRVINLFRPEEALNQWVVRYPELKDKPRGTIAEALEKSETREGRIVRRA